MDLIVKGKIQLNLKGMVTTLLHIPFYFIVHFFFPGSLGYTIRELEKCSPSIHLNPLHAHSYLNSNLILEI